MQILIVDDNDQDRYLLKFLLRESAHTVIEANSAQQAIDLFKEHRPNLILLDIQLPHIDGFELTSMLKSFPEVSEIPIIAVTAHVLKEDRTRIAEAGMDGLIEKPVDPYTFMDRLGVYLSDV